MNRANPRDLSPPCKSAVLRARDLLTLKLDRPHVAELNALFPSWSVLGHAASLPLSMAGLPACSGKHPSPGSPVSVEGARSGFSRVVCTLLVEGPGGGRSIGCNKRIRHS